MMLIKLSIGFFLLRLAVQKRYTYTVYASMVIVLIWSLALFFWDIFQCSPVQAQWDYTIPNLKCVSAQEVVNTAYALSVMTIVTDWLYALLPIPMIWKVKMNKQTKATVVVILGLGIFASIATLIRLKYLADLTDTSDILFAGTDAMVWTLVEPGVAITAASLVTIRPLLRQIRLKGFESTERGRSVPFNGRSLGSKTNRSKYSGMPDCGPDDLKLKDLEQGYGGAKGTSPQGTFVPSRTSTIGGRTIWGGAVEETLREADDEDQITPIGNDGAGSVVSTLISDGSMVESPRRAHQGQRTWRSETPLSSEESDQLQGLTYPSRRDVECRGARYPSSLSLYELTNRVGWD
ncbi:hypothetical protein SLS53_000287 [Cytospora paraplurivora]|uniref:Rhodopsin domain-containing protein n=1 Tax=Cytospora paraplurivora TaxID=2898453 RepID=A0AAN9UX87_9PEZI